MDTSEEQQHSIEDSESSDDDSSVEENENSEEYKRLVDLVWNKQDKNHDNYDIQKEVLDEVLNFGDTTLASYSVQIMSDCFPLSPEIWKKYIDLRKRKEDDEVSIVRDLYSKALFDYYSLELQQEYLTFSLKCDIDTIRNCFEQALIREGLHPLHGFRIWESYRLYESSHLSVLEEDSTEQRTQLNRLSDIIIRQISAPLQYEEDLYSVLVNLNEAVPNLVDLQAADKLKREAKKLLDLYLTFEKSLDEIKEVNSLEKLGIFTNYITTVQDRSDSSPKFIESLYHRATTEFCLNTDLWKQFCLFAISQKNSDADTTKSNIDNIIYNALRNVPWSTDIWILKLRWQEHCNASLEDIKNTFEKALASCTNDLHNIWMAYLECLKRKTDFNDSSSIDIIRNTFNLAIETLNRDWAGYAHSIYITQFWARLEYTILKDPVKGRELWNQVLGFGNNKTDPYLWLEMAKLEEGRGIDQARKIYRRAVLECRSSVLIDAWLAFERLNGTLETLEKCIKTCDEQSHKFSERDILKSYQEPRKRRAHFNDNGQDRNKRFKFDREQAKARKPKVKSVNDEPMDCSGSNDIPKKSNKSKRKEKSKQVDEEMKEGTDISNLHIEEKHAEFDPAKDNITIFISNLDYTVTEEQLVSALKEKGNLEITEANLLMKPNGTNKGFAYVVLSSPAEVEKALALDRTPLLSARPTYISSCSRDKDKRKHAFTYKEELEKNKLFIRGLPYDVGADELRERFGKFGEIEDVRLVTYRSGRSKGIAFVDYKDDSSASAAVLHMDNTKIKEQTITVALSAPPPRKGKFRPSEQSGSTRPGFNKSLGAGAGATTTGQTQGILRKAKMSFIPRSVQKAVQAENGNKDVSMEQTETSEASSKPKTNNDFRNMLLSNK